MIFFIRTISCLILVFLMGCASLTKTQINSVNKYALLLEKNSDYPGAILTEYINIQYEIQKLNTGTFHDTLVNTKLWNSYKGKNKALKEVRKVDLSLKIIGEYAAALNKLSSKELYENIKNPSQKLGTHIDTLINEFNSINNNPIPAGIGMLISKGLTECGQSYVKNKQAKELKKFIQEGEPLVSLTTTCINNNLDTLIIRQWIPGLKLDLKVRQENLLQNLNPKGDYKAYYATEFNKEVALLMVRIDNLDQLAIKTISSVKRLGKAHSELLKNIQERKQIKEVLKETQRLFLTTREIYETYISVKSKALIVE
jgi:hypothetical protein